MKTIVEARIIRIKRRGRTAYKVEVRVSEYPGEPANVDDTRYIDDSAAEALVVLRRIVGRLSLYDWDT